MPVKLDCSYGAAIIRLYYGGCYNIQLKRPQMSSINSIEKNYKVNTPQ